MFAILPKISCQTMLLSYLFTRMRAYIVEHFRLYFLDIHKTSIGVKLFILFSADKS